MLTKAMTNLKNVVKGDVMLVSNYVRFKMTKFCDSNVMIY